MKYLSILLLLAAACTIAPKDGEPVSDTQLWRETCGSCHALIGRGAYTSEEWSIIVHQMRVRANLPQDDAERIEEFLR